ncbi:MAG: hypothetical protein A3J12_07620 [Omnitrophica bacterium RIFCSPLOWO2_02_FULL_44_11]|nr:MAG: hypothetical protein A3J12_07620 [Omnitrophica bacterium RIFCSPLOWO2_02_FULL_44_11]
MMTCMGNMRTDRKEKGLTLIEVLVAVSIASILTAGIERLLDTALTAWRYSIEEAVVSKMAEDVTRRMSEGDYELQGLRDAVEIVDAQKKSVSFVPLWLDAFDQPTKGNRFYLSNRIRKGSAPPIGEVKFRGETEFHTYRAFVHTSDSGTEEWIEFGFPISKGNAVRIAYHPDYRKNPETLMRYEWDKEKSTIFRHYNDEVADFDLNRSSVHVTDAAFEYYDGYDRLLELKDKDHLDANQLVQVTAVESNIVFRGKELERKSNSFINVRALGKSGQGILLKEGLEFPIPNSEDIRALQLLNFSEIREGAMIELKIYSKTDQQSWRIKLQLGIADGSPVIKGQEIFYPENKLMFDSFQEASIRQGYDLLNVGGNGTFDYDDDGGIVDKVNFKGDDVFLKVIRMDIEGCMLIVRP